MYNKVKTLGYDEYDERRRIPRIPIRGLSIVAIILIIIIGIALFLSVGRVNVGYVAVIVDPIRGTVDSAGDGASSRYFFKPPWANLVQVYVATESVHMWTDIDPSTGQTAYGDFAGVRTLTKDGLGVEVDVTVRWVLAPGQVKELYKKFPALDWEDRAIVPTIREAIRDTMVKFTAIQTIEQRELVSVELTKALSHSLALEPSLVNATVLSAIDLRDIELPTTFVAAIEEKLAAEQLAIAAQFNATKILVLANATKYSAIIEAEGMATSRLIIANATYESIKTIAGGSMNSTQLTYLYLYLEGLKDIAKTGDTMILVVGDNQTVPFIAVP